MFVDFCIPGMDFDIAWSAWEGHFFVIVELPLFYFQKRELSMGVFFCWGGVSTW